MKDRLILFSCCMAALTLLGASVGRAGTATDIAGLYFTGVNANGAVLPGGNVDPNWTVTYASTNGGNSQNNAYKGPAYVVSSSFIDGAWTQNTTSAKWITAPGASISGGGGAVNIGGDFLPGNGDKGKNNAIFIYTLAFNIVGKGSGTVTNAVSITLTLSADDQYRVYVNPVGDGTTDPTAAMTASGSATNAWNNTTAVILQNGSNGTGTSGNAIFKIGLNYLSVVVENTNSITGQSNNTSLNPSGLLVYQVGSATLIDGKPIPEVGTWLPVVGAVLLYGGLVWRRRRRPVSL